MDYVTVSTKVRKSLLEKARRYGINLSYIMRKAIEDEVRRKEMEWALSVMEDILRKARSDKPSEELIRKFRESRR